MVRGIRPQNIRQTVGLLVGGAAALTFALAQPVSGQSRDAKPERCPVKSASRSVIGPAVSPAIELEPEPASQARVVNFDTSRDLKYTSFSVTADPPLPAGAERRLNLVADTIVRTGNDKTETVLFPDATFSELKISGNRNRITFDVCLDPPDDLSAGSYAGSITVDGPPGIEATSVTVTLNAKNGALFKGGLAVTTLFALGILFYKEASAKRTAAVTKAGTDEAKKAEAEKWGPHLRHTRTDFGWWVPTIFALGSMIGVLLALWYGNQTWGDSGLNSVVALIGAGMAAIGAREIFIPRSRDTD